MIASKFNGSPGPWAHWPQIYLKLYLSIENILKIIFIHSKYVKAQGIHHMHGCFFFSAWQWL